MSGRSGSFASVRNFVIVYRAREGSSALIDLLSKHPDIKVPVFEHLDSYVAAPACSRTSIASLVALIYATGDHDQARALLASGAAPPDPVADRAVGFKWRIWGNADQVAKVLIEQRVTVFHLFRLKLRELVVSLMLTDTVIPALRRAGIAELPPGGHLQFDFAAMDQDQRTELQRRLGALRFRLDPAQFRATARDWLTGKQEVHDTYLRSLAGLGVPVHAILYEDLCDNRAALLHRLCGAIGVDPGKLLGAETWYRKVHAGSPSQQVENWPELNAGSELREIVAAWRELIFQCHSYLGPARVTAKGFAA